MKFTSSARWGIAQWQQRIRLKTGRAAVRPRGRGGRTQDPFQAPSLGLSRGRPHGSAAARAGAGARRGGARNSPLPRAFANGIVPYVVALGAFGIALGFAVATFKTSLIDHPVLRFSTSGVTVAGFVELREESQHTDRFVLRVERIEGGRMDD
jgi:hypothetical protein